MRVERLDRSGIASLRLTGADALDMANAHDIKRGCLEAVEDGLDVVVDLSEVDFVDSAGVGVLVSVYKRTRLRGRRAAFVGVRPGVLAVLAILRLDQIFEIRPDAPAALRAIAVGIGDPADV
jgi:anti-sigma B factor antagonist